MNKKEPKKELYSKQQIEEEFDNRFSVTSDQEWVYLPTKDVIQYPEPKDLKDFLFSTLDRVVKEAEYEAFKKGMDAGISVGWEKSLDAAIREVENHYAPINGKSDLIEKLSHLKK